MCHPRCVYELYMDDVWYSNTTVSSQIFIDYKIDTVCFGTFGYHQVSSKIT